MFVLMFRQGDLLHTNWQKQQIGQFTSEGLHQAVAFSRVPICMQGTGIHFSRNRKLWGALYCGG